MFHNPFKLLPFLLALQIILGVALGTPNTIAFPESNTYLQVEIADSTSERKKGLMYREELSINEGMLFVFPREEERGFWMKNTLIPLDMIFVDSKGKILNIEEAYPEPNTSDEDLKTYRSEGEARYVIETNSSFAERYNLEAGDRVKIPGRLR